MGISHACEGLSIAGLPVQTVDTNAPHTAPHLLTMATRGVFQLRKLTVKYCEYGGSSKGAREFIRHRIVEFANKTPAAEVVTELRPGHHPYISADYETGENKAIGVKNITPSEIMDYAMTLRNSSGRKVSSGKYFVSGANYNVPGMICVVAGHSLFRPFPLYWTPHDWWTYRWCCCKPHQTSS